MDDAIVALENECHDLEKSVHHDLAFHRAIATATHNELFLVLHDSMGEMLLEVRRRNLSKGRDERRLVVGMHRRIRDGIAAHDADAARSCDARPPRARRRDLGRPRRLALRHARLVGLLVGHHLEQGRRGRRRRSRSTARGPA